MRILAHSKSLAVSLLLWTMIGVPPVAQAAASAPIKGLNISPLPQNSSQQTICLNTLTNTHLNVYDSLMPVQFERVSTENGSGVVVTQPKEALSQAILPSKTVLKRVTQDDLKEEFVSSPTPSVVALNSTAISQQTRLGTTNGVLNADVLFNLVNATRAQYGLAPFQKDDRICAVAVSRAPELDNEIWVTHTMHAGFYARNLPYWATENIISMHTEQEALNWWLNSPVHRAALLGNYTHACTACSGGSCGMIFTNFEPKQIVVAPTQVAVPTHTPSASSSTPIIISPVTQAAASVVK